MLHKIAKGPGTQAPAEPPAPPALPENSAPPNGASGPSPASAQPSTSSAALPFVPGPVYKRVTVPPSAPPPLPSEVPGRFSLPLAEPTPSLVFSGAPNGNAAPAVFPGQFDEKLTEKIARDEFVEMSEILGNEKTRFGVVLAENERELSLVSKKSRVLSEAQWIKAFCLYSIEYLQHYPEAKIDMFLYAIKITDLTEDPGMDWRFYDRTFRMERRRLGLSFRHMRMDLESKASRLGSSASASGSSSQPFRVGWGRSSQPSTPLGYCFQFHEGSGCYRQSCCFKHECPRCGARHPAADKKCPPARPGKREQFRPPRGRGKSPRGESPRGNKGKNSPSRGK